MRDTPQKQFSLELDYIYKNQTKLTVLMESGVSETISNLTSDTRDKLGTNGRNTRDKIHPLNFNTSFFKGSY